MSFLLQELTELQSKRKFPNWEPKPNQGFKKLDSTIEEEVVYRCLDFVDLEVQVGDWIKAVGAQIDEEALVSILMRNVADEAKHDRAIRDLRQYYSYTKIPTKAHVISTIWSKVEDNPIVAAYALEMGVFFTILPLLMRFGDVYASMVAGWINDDERIHVETNLRLMKHFGLKLSHNIVFLVYKTVEYIYEPMGAERASKEADRAVRRLTTTKDPQMMLESLPITISYFEQNNNADVVY